MSLIRTVAKGLFAGGDLFLPTPRGPRILIYHQIGAGLGRQMEVSEESFRRQLDWLMENRQVVSLDDAVGNWGHPASNEMVVLTFDDGYVDTHTRAFPLLKERGLPFVLYLATESIESGQTLGPETGAEPLVWSMIGEMVASGLLTIGAHTHTHRDLRDVPRLEVEREIALSNDLIADRLGIVPRHFAYPWGYWSKVANSVVRERYKTAVLGGSPRPHPDPPPHRLHRYPVQLGDGVAFFKARLSGGLLLEESVRRRVRGYNGP